MSPESVGLWIQRAESDLKTGLDEIKSDQPAVATVCYLMQQAAEKFMKAYLSFRGRTPPKTHNLDVILNACALEDPDFSTLLDSGVDALTQYAYDFRYPDDFYVPSMDETRAAVDKAENVRRFVLDKLTSSGYIPQVV